MRRTPPTTPPSKTLLSKAYLTQSWVVLVQIVLLIKKKKKKSRVRIRMTSAVTIWKGMNVTSEVTDTPKKNYNSHTSSDKDVSEVIWWLHQTYDEKLMLET